MICNTLKKLTALLAAALILMVTGIIFKIRGEDEHYCTCDGNRCKCKGSEPELQTHESSVKKLSRLKGVGTQKPETIDAVEVARTADTLKDLFENIKDSSPSNKDIARIIISLINLQNAVDPKRAVDVRSIRFMKSGDQGTMEIDFCTDEYGKSTYEDGLSRLWGNIFLAENFWNADFVKVRVTTRDKESNEPLEVISCNFDDVSKYLLKEISLGEFQASWSRRRAEATKIRNLARLKHA